MIDYSAIEKKWQDAWNEARIFEPEPNDKEGMLVTAAFPYVNAPPHMGHLRTYGTADFYARFMRMQGFNVLFPFAFHATGTPVLAFAKRLQNNDMDLIDELKLFHVSDEDIEKMKDPAYISEYFIKQVQSEWKKAGLGIDWRRKFISIEPLYGKLVEWQFINLKALGLITKGTHPVGWCENEKNAVGQHDTKHDIQPEIELVTAILFKDSASGVYFPCTTYRPETVYCATNIFIRGNAGYSIAAIGDKRYYIANDALELLKPQLNPIIEGSITSEELLSKKAINPVTNEEIPVLDGFFVKPDFGTGVVMSVPAHAPFDYIALERIKAVNPDVVNFTYKSCISVPNQKATGKIPVLAYLESFDANPDAIDEQIERATKALYREELKNGVMEIGNYKGKSVVDARRSIKQDMEKEKNAIEFYIVANSEPVYCRCGRKVTVKIVSDQWFINYGDQKWKGKMKGMFGNVKIYPEKFIPAFNNSIDWIDMRPAERSQGLGTAFPFNPEHIIEPLSDSTIYPSFYTYVHILRAKGIEPSQLKSEFFDYIIRDIGTSEKTSVATGISKDIIDRCKDSFEYWYRYTSRHSGPDLIPSHLIMYVFNHIALFPEKLWPKQMVVNGMVNYDGTKMSKSLGNVIPLGDAVEKYGADIIRFIEIANGDLGTDVDFSLSSVNGIRQKNQRLYDIIEDLSNMHSDHLTGIDYWLYSKLNSKIDKANRSMAEISIRDAYIEIYYNSINELKWYFDMGGYNSLVVKEFMEKITLMLSPIMPHLSEEFWHMLGNKTLSSAERWPSFDPNMINNDIEMAQEQIAGIIEDVNRILGIASAAKSNEGRAPKALHIILADKWKYDAYNILQENRSISETMKNELLKGIGAEKLSGFLTQYAKKIHGMKPVGSFEAISDSLESANESLSRRLGLEVMIEKEAESKSERAGRAAPDKPSIDIEWA